MHWPRARYEHCVITGASSGIGSTFAEVLAPRARLLTLVARREERLRVLAGALEAAHPVRCTVAPVDLADPEGPRRLATLLEGRDAVDVLVNNAGFGRHGPWEAFDWDEWRRLFQVNMLAAAELLHRLWPVLTGVPGRGAINVASTAGFQPMPWFAAYAASKAFLRSLSGGLAGEGRRCGTRVLSLCPGPTQTEFGDIAGTRWSAGFLKMGPEAVVAAALSAYDRGVYEVVPGSLNKLAAALSRLAPAGIVLRGAAWAGRRAAGEPRAPRRRS